jgi:SAM-dependent methyltransferase
VHSLIRDNSDGSWEEWGKQNPYYAVLSDDKFRRGNLNNELKVEFFDSGRVHIEKVLATVVKHFGTMTSQKSALDFGCGVGRLVIPLAQIFTHVVGVDISPAMLRIAEQNCLEYGISNVDFVRSDDELTRVTGKFDFIHSFIVLQHISVRRGEKIIGRLLDRLNPEGVLAIHFPLKCKSSAIRRFIDFLRKNCMPLLVLANIGQRKRWDEPFMQMNSYDLNAILALLSKHGIKDVVLEAIDSHGYLSAYVFAKLPGCSNGRTACVSLGPEHHAISSQ